MSPEQHEELIAEPSRPVAHTSRFAYPARASTGRVLTFKFGGTSLLGAERMLRATSLVREAQVHASIVVVVSAMKGVTDPLLAVARRLEPGCPTDARRYADHVFPTHLY